MKHVPIRITLAMIAAIALAMPGSAQVSPETLKSLSIPNKVETQLGTLEL